MSDDSKDTKTTPGSGDEAVVRRKPKPPETTAPDDAVEGALPATAEAPSAVTPSTAHVDAPPAAPEPSPPKAAAPKRAPDEDVDFGELLDATRIQDQEIEQGMLVSGRLVAFSGEWAFVDLGAKTEGILGIAEVTDEGGQLTKGIGDVVEAFVASTSGGEIRLSVTLGQQIRDGEALLDARDSGIPVEGKVVATNKGGFEVRIGGRRAFCPLSQIELAYTEDPSLHVGQTYRFRVKEVAEKGKRIVVSRAELLREERDEQRAELREHLEIGAVLDGTVTSIQDYGAFVDLGGLEGLVHISELSWGRVEHPSEVLKEGDAVEVKILNIKQTEKGDRIGLSLRETLPHPWIQVGTKFVEGDTYRGTVTRLEPYGAFVELGPGVEGLVHVSELSWERRVNHPNEILTVGEPIDVYVKSIDDERRRIGLSVKALSKNPWAEVEGRYAPGNEVTGTVERVQPFGVFVEVEPGVTALIPASESNTGHGADLKREFTIGQAVTATVLSVDGRKKRMSLSLKAKAELQDKAAMKDFFDGQKKAAKEEGGFGTLGDLFADKLNK